MPGYFKIEKHFNIMKKMLCFVIQVIKNSN